MISASYVRSCEFWVSNFSCVESLSRESVCLNAKGISNTKVNCQFMGGDAENKNFT